MAGFFDQPDPTNPFVPSSAQTLFSALTNLGAGISAVSARNLPFYYGIAPGAQAFENGYNNQLARGANYDLAQKNYALNKSLKDIQEQKLALETDKLKSDLGFRKQALDWLNGGGGVGEAAAPGIRAPKTLMGPDFGAAIAATESAGQPNNGYGAIGPDTGHGRAYGRYQVMDSNIGPWTQEVLGKAMTPQEFLANPAAQDAVFKAKFGQYLQKYGNPQDAASMWFSGHPLQGNKAGPDVLGTTVPEYVNRFNRNLYGSAPVSQPDTSFSPAASPTGGVSPPGATPASSGAVLPGMPQMPGPPPDTTRLDALSTMNVPGVSDIAKAKADAIKRQYQFQKDQYTRDFQAWAERNKLANNDIIIDPNTGLPTVNQQAIEAKKAVSAIQGTDQEGKMRFLDYEGASKANTGIQGNADTARTGLMQTGRLASLLDQIQTGRFKETTTGIKAMAKGLGIDLGSLGITDDVGPAQAAQALSSQLALTLRNPSQGAGMPGSLSDSDRKFLASMVPGLETTPEGRKLMLEYSRKMYQRQIDLAKVANDFMRSPEAKQDPLKLYTKLQEYADSHPLFSEDDAKKAAGISQTARPPLSSFTPQMQPNGFATNPNPNAPTNMPRPSLDSFGR